MKRILLALLALVGCRLGELLDPGPPPPPEKCYQTWRFRIIQQNDADTTYYVTSREVPCPKES